MRSESVQTRRRAGLAARVLVPLVALLLAPLAVFAGDGASNTGGENEPDAALATALGSVKTDSIRADIHFVASDQMRGRYTPSPELVIVARYLRARLQRLGFEPGAGADFLYEYDLDYKALDPQRTALKITSGAGTDSLAFGEGFFYSRGNLGGDADTAAGVVFCGNASEEELEGAELEGAWALVADTGERRSFYRALRSSGAVGMLVMPAASYDGEPYADRYKGSTERLLKGTYAYNRPDGSDQRMSPFSQVYLSPESAGKLMLAAGVAPGALPAVRARLPITVTEEKRLVGGEDNKVTVENVCGMWRGSDPVLSKEVIIVSAHYDHIGVKGEEVCNGADDNGSGTTGLLAVAEALAAHGPFRRSVMLIWVSGEERGLWGSAAWKDNPVLPAGFTPVANLNIDMIGRNAPDELFITPTAEHEKHNFIVKVAQSLAPLEGFPELGDADKFYGRSDQANFEQLGIPVAFLFSGLHDDYHQPSDTPDKIDCDKIRRVARLVVRLIDSLQTDQLGG